MCVILVLCTGLESENYKLTVRPDGAAAVVVVVVVGGVFVLENIHYEQRR